MENSQHVRQLVLLLRLIDNWASDRPAQLESLKYGLEMHLWLQTSTKPEAKMSPLGTMIDDSADITESNHLSQMARIKFDNKQKWKSELAEVRCTQH